MTQFVRLLLLGVTLSTSLQVRGEDFEMPADEPAGASVPAAQLSGKYFHIDDPVHNDGLMHCYVLESRFGVFKAYGRGARDAPGPELAARPTIAG
jgi:hypothetical protein